VLQKHNARKPSGYIIVTYPCRALDWIDLKKIFISCLTEFELDSLIEDAKETMFAWKYHENLAAVLYKPAEVFKKFSVLQLLDPLNECECLKANRFSRFLDSQTKDETSSFAKAQVHVRTMDARIVQNPGLREAISMGLNYIPLKPTNIAVSIATALDAFAQFAAILNLENTGLPMEEATKWVRIMCLNLLKNASRVNKWGLRFSGTDLLQSESVKNEI